MEKICLGSWRGLRFLSSSDGVGSVDSHSVWLYIVFGLGGQLIEFPLVDLALQDILRHLGPGMRELFDRGEVKLL